MNVITEKEYSSRTFGSVTASSRAKFSRLEAVRLLDSLDIELVD